MEKNINLFNICNIYKNSKNKCFPPILKYD